VKGFLYGWFFLKTIVRRFLHDRFAFSASALTFTTLLALVPLITVCVSILSAFPVFKAFGDNIQQLIFQNFIPASGEMIQHYLQEFVAQTGKLSFIGTVALIVAAILMMLTAEDALNDVWHVARRPFSASSFLRYWAVLSLAPIIIGFGIAAVSYVVSSPLVMVPAVSLGVYHGLMQMVPVILTCVGFSLLYILVPSCEVPVRYGVVGAIVATILFELAKKAFVIYVKNFPTYQLIYGALSAIPIFLIWIYCLWLIILLGALISNVLTTRSYLPQSFMDKVLGR
jgi:membrane protein